MPRNTYSRKDYLKVVRWLEENHARLLQARPTVAEAAAQATTALGFTVSAGNLEGATKDVELQPFWRVHHAGTQEARELAARVESLEAHAKAVTEALANADKHLMHLEDELSRVMLHIINNGSKNGLIQLQSSHVETVRRMRGTA